MGNHVRIASLCAVVLLAPTLSFAADAPTLTSAKELQWVDVAEPAGAKQAPLWGDAKSADSGVMVRWKFNSKMPEMARAHDLHIVVMAGTFTVEIAGGYREFGPGGYVSIPRGVKHALGCEAAGECKFVMHRQGAAE